MFSQATLFLIILFFLGFVGKNQSIMIAIYILFGIQLFNLDSKLFPYLQDKGITIGVTIITIAVLIPIATGEIGFRELVQSAQSYYAWIAIGAGVFVAIVAKNGLILLAEDPQLTTALVLGTIFAVVAFQGVAVGPLIGAGIAFFLIKLINLFHQ
ncbi:DUF441 domain-containing protein [Aquibacillus salsiterrae]|uniref:UPF0756 membrane protein NC799_02330 n=1 Tax=Aquibacillus salsiterrae TaxID=2950439 RepID=A0A9X3WCD0_9BACI|nr:DUF441 domain-containing protein [Aquibacillus salsiterrae]MDC3415746.1 DUF441 domain-containing protein [Aquibacillus salsiterrae]